MAKKSIGFDEEVAAELVVAAVAEGVSCSALVERWLARDRFVERLEAGDERDWWEILVKALLDMNRRLETIERHLAKPKKKAREATEKANDGILDAVLALGAPLAEIVSEDLWREFVRMRVFTKRPLSVEEAAEIAEECKVVDENGWDVAGLLRRCVDLRYLRPFYAQHIDFMPPSHHGFAKRK